MEKDYTKIDANINPKLLAPYNPSETESRIYKIWEDSGFFNPDVCVEKGIVKSDAESFTVMLPPPNVTGRLHLGHALEHSLQDSIVRYQRMKGKKVLWLPGTDHAAIATQSRYEKESGNRRHDFKRDEFFDMVYEFGIKNQKDMQKQMRLFGSSLDWSREAFTLDEKRSVAVKTAFKKMYDDGLIYRGHRIINWDPKGQTTIADDEIVYEERKSKMYTFKYSADFPISISTTRPETKVGDTAVAVHPEDARYKEFVGKTYNIKDFCGVELNIKVIADEAVEMDFGTGALGVTPAHSQTDWEIADRHDLPRPQVINEYAKMMVGGEDLIGKKTTDAREVIVGWLRVNNLLEKEEEVNQNISTAERTGGIIEPLPKLQWFVNVNKPIESKGGKSLKDLMQNPVTANEITIIPDRYAKIYENWINNLRDWCISRQIIFGHRIPVYYRGDEIKVGEKPEGDDWSQDEDTLDTWFSSALWTFSTLGWPENTEDFKNFHPTSFMNPGYEIIFFWVARMVLMSEYLLGTVPFKTVYLHGIVRDKNGVKFSKSLKNGIEPEEIVKDLGTDALRMSMIVGIGPGNDLNFDLQKVKAYSKFANKLWNITRFVLQNTDGTKIDYNFADFVEADRELIKKADELQVDLFADMDNFRFYLAGEKIYHYAWHEFADIILEDSKKIFESGSEEEKLSRKQFLLHTQERILKLLHPFMPFVTEELWNILGHDDLLMVNQY